MRVDLGLWRSDSVEDGGGGRQFPAAMPVEPGSVWSDVYLHYGPERHLEVPLPSLHSHR